MHLVYLLFLECQIDSSSARNVQLRRNIQQREAINRLKQKIHQQKKQLSSKFLQSQLIPASSSSKYPTQSLTKSSVSQQPLYCNNLSPPKKILPKQDNLILVSPTTSSTNQNSVFLLPPVQTTSVKNLSFIDDGASRLLHSLVSLGTNTAQNPVSLGSQSSSNNKKTILSFLDTNNKHLQPYLKDSRPVFQLLQEERDKLKTVLRQPARPCSVTNDNNSESSACHAVTANCCSVNSRKRPYTALDDPLCSVWEESSNTGCLDDVLRSLMNSTPAPSSVPPVVPSSSPALAPLLVPSSIQSSRKHAPVVQQALLNRSVENLTFQQLQSQQQRRPLSASIEMNNILLVTNDGATDRPNTVPVHSSNSQFFTPIIIQRQTKTSAGSSATSCTSSEEPQDEEQPAPPIVTVSTATTLPTGLSPLALSTGCGTTTGLSPPRSQSVPVGLLFDFDDEISAELSSCLDIFTDDFRLQTRHSNSNSGGRSSISHVIDTTRNNNASASSTQQDQLLWRFISE